MKIQMNGFDIEIETSDADMMVKVIDANGQELSNNTYAQTLETSDDVEDVDVPSVDDMGDDEEENEEGVEETDTEDEESSDDTDDDTDDDTETDDVDGEDDITFDENKVYDFETFKKLKNKRK